MVIRLMSLKLVSNALVDDEMIQVGYPLFITCRNSGWSISRKTDFNAVYLYISVH